MFPTTDDHALYDYSGLVFLIFLLKPVAVSMCVEWGVSICASVFLYISDFDYFVVQSCLLYSFITLCHSFVHLLLYGHFYSFAIIVCIFTSIFNVVCFNNALRYILI